MNELTIHSYLKEKGLNEYGIAGLMGNLFAESGLNPRNLQNNYESVLGMNDNAYVTAVDDGSYTNFVQDKAGFGLAQWTYWSRKQALLDFARSVGKSIGDLLMQLDFLWKELSESYPGVVAVLRSATSVLEASNAVLLNYERPANQSEGVQKKRAEYGQRYYNQFATETEKKGDGKMNVSELIRKLQNIVNNYKTIYVMGCFGAPLTERNVNRYLNNHEYNRRPERQKMIRSAANQDPPVYGFDCVCLIKGVLWGWNGDPSKSYGGAVYGSNSVPDVSADGMIKKCEGVTTDFSGIVPGAAVWMKGHIGVYIGDGLAVECSPKWENKVQITAVGNLGKKSGYNTRTWTKWGLMPYVDYNVKEDDDDMTELQVKEICKQVMAEQRKELQDNDCGSWSKEARDWATSIGLIAGGGTLPDGTPNYMWADNLTREQAAALFFRFAQMMGKA